MLKLKEKISLLEDVELREELLSFYADAEKMAAVLAVYSDKRNWRREWFGQHKYNYVFNPKDIVILDKTVQPNELMDSVARQCKLP